ncbi:MAG: VWA domain-containing protein [Nitrospirota bacterium]|nr:VWA domain-containing protein [Nitrospirota bacterium]
MTITAEERKDHFSRMIKQKKDELNMLKKSRTQGLDILFLFDSTGSMEDYIEEARRCIVRVVSEVSEYVPDARMGAIVYKDHGDEGEDDFYLLKVSPMSLGKERLIKFIRSADIAPGEGGSGPEAVECALHEANLLDWRKNVPNVIVLIGDKPPHGVMDSFSACSRGIDYRKEVSMLKSRGTKVYSVLCNNVTQTEATFRWISKETGGKFLCLDEAGDLSSLIIGICARETGQLPYYERKLLQYGAMTPSIRTLLSRLKDGPSEKIRLLK